MTSFVENNIYVAASQVPWSNVMYKWNDQIKYTAQFYLQSSYSQEHDKFTVYKIKQKLLNMLMLIPYKWHLSRILFKFTLDF